MCNCFRNNKEHTRAWMHEQSGSKNVPQCCKYSHLLHVQKRPKVAGVEVFFSPSHQASSLTRCTTATCKFVCARKNKNYMDTKPLRQCVKDYILNFGRKRQKHKAQQSRNDLILNRWKTGWMLNQNMMYCKEYGAGPGQNISGKLLPFHI